MLVLVVLSLCHTTVPPGTFALREDKNINEEAFATWLEGGVTLGKVDLANFTHPIFSNYKLRGVKAVANLKAGDLILSASDEMVLSTVSPTTPELAKFLTAHANVLSLEERLTIQVLVEINNSSSKWSPFFRVMPHKFFTSCEFTAEELRQLEGSKLFLETKERQKMFEDEFSKISKLLKNETVKLINDSILTFPVFKYSRLIVQTRAFSFHIHQQQALVLIPFADMLNHKEDAKIRWEYDSEQHKFHLFTEEPYVEDTQVFNSYGARSNRNLLLDFGFTVPENSHDFYEFPPPAISPSDSKRLSILSQLGSPYKPGYVAKLGSIPEDLLVAVRIAHATPAELIKLERDIQMRGSTGARNVPHQMLNQSISVQNEIDSLNWIANASHHLLTTYRDTYEEDTALLEKGEGLTRNLFNAILIRQIEKRILVHIADVASSYIPILQWLSEYQHHTGSTTVARMAMVEADYIEHVLIPLNHKALEEHEAD